MNPQLPYLNCKRNYNLYYWYQCFIFTMRYPRFLFWNWSIDCNPEMHWILFSTNCDYPKPNYLRGTIKIKEDKIYTSFLHCERKDQLYLNLLRILPTGVVSKKLIGALIIASNSRSCNIPAAVTEAMATDTVCTNMEIAKK